MNITIYQGESKSLDYVITDAKGDPVDLTFMLAEWRLASRTDETPIVTKTLDDGVTYTDAAQGLLTVELTPEDTAIPSGMYRRELRLRSSGYAQTPDYGSFVVSDSLFIED